MIDGPVARLKFRSDIAARIPADEPYCGAYSTTAIDRVPADPAPNWNGIVDCEVLIVDPPQRLSYNWGVGGSESGLQWVVLWTLTPAEGGTHVRMEQSGFRPDQQAAYQGANYGWQKFFGNLERVLNGRRIAHGMPLGIPRTD